MLEQLKKQWDEILLHLKEEHELLDVSYKTWLLPLKVYSVEGNTVSILAPDANFVTYIRKKYGFLLQAMKKSLIDFFSHCQSLLYYNYFGFDAMKDNPATAPLSFS